MRVQQVRKQVVLCLTLYLAAASGAAMQNAPTAATAPIAGATVADLKGKVQLELPGQATSAPSRGQVLPAETTVITGKGRILLRLEDGSEILVNSNTRLVLKQPSPTNWQRLLLLLGKIKAEVQKRVGGSPPFQVGTPSAVISVRGTRFYVEVDRHQVTRVTVEEGEVEVANVKGIGKPVRIKAGSSTSVGEDSAPEPPKEAPGQGRQQGNPGNVRDEGSLGAGQQSPGAGQRANPSAPRSGKKP